MANLRDNAVQGQVVELQVQFLDSNGEEVDADSTPTIEIRDADGDVILAATSRDISRVDTGLYEYSFTVPSGADLGLWTDYWSATIDNAAIDVGFNFTVIEPEDGISVNTGKGKIQIGDDIDMNFTDEEIAGINILLKYLKRRLQSNGMKPQRDEFGAFIRDAYGEVLTEECNVFDNLALVQYLCIALSEFNGTPFFTQYRFSDPAIYDLFSYLIVEGAYVISLASQSILEKGRDFQLNDGNFGYQPPQLGDFLQTHYSNWLSSYREKLKFVKDSIRPGPRSFGTFSSLNSSSPAFTRLRHLRQRRII